MNAIFASEKLENSNELVNAVANMTIKNFIYEINSATACDAQVKFSSDPDRINHTNNVITHQNLLSSQMIGIRHKKVSVLPPRMDPSIYAINQPDLSISTGIVLSLQMLKSPVVQEMVTDMA